MNRWRRGMSADPTEMLERLGTSPISPDAMEREYVLTVLEASERAGVRYGLFEFRPDEDR